MNTSTGDIDYERFGRGFWREIVVAGNVKDTHSWEIFGVKYGFRREEVLAGKVWIDLVCVYILAGRRLHRVPKK